MPAFVPSAERNRLAFFASFGETVTRADGTTTLVGILDQLTGMADETPGLSQAARDWTLIVRDGEDAIPLYETLTVGGTAYSVQSAGVPDGYGFTKYQLSFD